MALDRARLVLQDVVDTPEDALTLTENYELKVGDHTAIEVREALTVIGADLLTTHPHKDKRPELSLIGKETPHGRLTFGIIFGGTQVRKAGHVGQPEALRMELTTGKEGRYVLESFVLLQDRRAPWVPDIYRVSERFADWRGQKPDIALMNEALEDVSKGSMDKFKKIHSGLKWVAYNMLNWDGFQFPEDINRSPLLSKV